jgi:tRNA(Ile)-lysidine synthase TilS/MesJ
VTGSDLDILETYPFEADMGPACGHVVHKTIIDFLQDRGITAEKVIGKDPFPVIVSLSGGVDSMVIASVLSHLASDCNYNLNLYAIHIDYANCPESGAEADYVRRYCEGKGINFCLRRIDEVTRGITARDDYERIARDARYNCYRETIQHCKDVIGDSTIEVGVMLGHHRGDLRENFLICEISTEFLF